MDLDAQESFFDLSKRNFSKRMDSWSCGRNVSYQFCLDDCSGKYQKGLVSPYGNYAKYGFFSGAGTAKNPNVFFTNHVASVILRPYDPLKSGSVTLFQSGDCVHSSAAFEAPPYQYSTHSYSYSSEEMTRKGMAVGWADSIYIPYGLTATFYEGEYFEGRSVTIKGPMYTDGSKVHDKDATLGHSCINLTDYNFGDKVSSLAVTSTSSVSKNSRSYWQLE